MSGAAKLFVDTLVHPKVKGAARAFLKAIAEHVPDGQTTTPPLTLPDLAAEAQYSERTAWTCRNVLEQHGVIKVHDGGQGKAARYELLGLTGARPAIVVPLPLVGRAKPRRTKIERSTPDLFSGVETPTPAVFAGVVSTPIGNIRSFCVSWVVNIRNFCVSWGWRTKEQRSTPAVFAGVAAPVVDVDDARARGTYTLKETHTHAPPVDEPTAEQPRPPPAIAHPWHAGGWCGRVCVPKQLHQPWLQKGHTETWLLAFYARTCATLTDDQVRKAVVDEFKFWRAALAAELAAQSPGPRGAPPNPRAAPSPDLQERAEDERRQRQGSGF